jgi:mannitol-1-/sugar-/sorbitol-6-/2-deoxyglucose-6-phosphatase
VTGRDLPFEAAVFDMDGLLIDSEPLWREVEMDIFGRLGLPLTTELCLETRGMVLDEVTAHWYRLYPWPGPTPAAVAAEITEAMASLLATRLVLKAGALDAVAECRKRGLLLAVASSSPRRLIELTVEAMNAASWFSVLHSAQEEAAGKPDPGVFLTTARLLGVEPGRCVVFEDSPAGVEAALGAGMTCVAVPEDPGMGGDGPPAGFASAALIIGSLAEVDDDLWFRLGQVRGG